MPIFDPIRSREVHALFKLAYTCINFSAAFLLIIGSALFFCEALKRAGIWCFVVGSVCFALKPTLRLIREAHLIAIGGYDDVAGPAGRRF